VIAVLVALAAATGPTPAEVYTVDLAAALRALPAGREVSEALGKLQREREAEIRQREDRLLAGRAKMSPAAYRAQAEELAERIQGINQELGAAQDRLLAPHLAELRGYVADAQKRVKGIHIHEVGDVPLRGAPKACDATSWLIETARAGAVKAPPPRNPACRFDFFLYVDFDDIVRQMREGKAAIAKLDKDKDDKQNALDADQKKLATLRAKAEQGDPQAGDAARALAKQIEARYARMQQAIERAELAAMQRLYGQIERMVERLAVRTKGVAFVESLDGASTRMTPSCEVSSWVAGLIDVKAKVDDLDKVCPELAASRAR
jgi:Skp family chaperone for outer membrane proteins